MRRFIQLFKKRRQISSSNVVPSIDIALRQPNVLNLNRIRHVRMVEERALGNSGIV
jgi:hypothetical protein